MPRQPSHGAGDPAPGLGHVTMSHARVRPGLRWLQTQGDPAEGDPATPGRRRDDPARPPLHPAASVTQPGRQRDPARPRAAPGCGGGCRCCRPGSHHRYNPSALVATGPARPPASRDAHVRFASPPYYGPGGYRPSQAASGASGPQPALTAAAGAAAAGGGGERREGRQPRTWTHTSASGCESVNTSGVQHLHTHTGARARTHPPTQAQAPEPARIARRAVDQCVGLIGAGTVDGGGGGGARDAGG